MSDGPTITVARAAELLHCGRARVFELLADGTLERAPRFGRGTTIVTASVHRALALGPRRPGRRRRAPSTLAPRFTLEDLKEMPR